MEKGTITRRLEKTLDDLEDEFSGLYSKKDFETKLKRIEFTKGSSLYYTELKGIYKMLKAFGVEYEKRKEPEYYRSIVTNLDIPDSIEDKMILTILNKFRMYATPEEYMLRIVNRCCNKEDGWENDTLRVRILKQFIKYGDYLSKAGYGGKSKIKDHVKAKTGKTKITDGDILSSVDDEIFGILDNATKEQKKAKGSYGLIKIADDLALGKFRTGGATKESLYLLAIVFGMTYCTDKNDQDPLKDIDKNLFHDYYSNNFMRYLTDAYRGKKADYEKDPSEQGINYKNFAEMIFVYFISRQNMTPPEKIEKIYAMIDRVKNNDTSVRKNSSSDSETVIYRELYTDEVFEKSEEEFEHFIRENYNCSTEIENESGKKYNIGAMQVNNAQNSAFVQYKSIIADLDALAQEQGESRENFNYGLWFGDISVFEKEGYEDKFLKKYPQIDRKDFVGFKELLLAVNAYVGHNVKEEANDIGENREKRERSVYETPALYIDSPENVTRSSLITAYYYYYNMLNEDKGRRKSTTLSEEDHSIDTHNDKRSQHDQKLIIEVLKDEDYGLSFSEVWEDFKSCIDEYLADAFYQPLSQTNLFDVLIVFSAYSYQCG